MWRDDESRGKLSDEGVRREIGRDGRRQRKWRRREGILTMERLCQTRK